MLKSMIKHENLRRVIQEMDLSVDDDVALEILSPELNQSTLLSPVYMDGDEIHYMKIFNEQGTFAALFTDMYEFRKTFPDSEIEPKINDFLYYKLLFQCLSIDGFVLNPNSEGIILEEPFFRDTEMYTHKPFSNENTYSASELIEIRQSIDNTDLEEFIRNPKNTGRYEELFDLISKTTLFTLILSDENLKDVAEDGVIAMKENDAIGFLYNHKIGGLYATAYTSESKISSIKSKSYRYSQIVNFSQMIYFILHFDMDGIIINPCEENVMISREVLLEFSSLLHEKCNDQRLNSAIDHVFLLEDEDYV